MKSPLTLSSPRIRFNWGFHDATADKLRKRNRIDIPQGKLFCLPRHDKPYCAGYFAGQRADISQGKPESSEPAWREHKGEIEEKRTERARIRDMRPALWERRF